MQGLGPALLPRPIGWVDPHARKIPAPQGRIINFRKTPVLHFGLKRLGVLLVKRSVLKRGSGLSNRIGWSCPSSRRRILAWYGHPYDRTAWQLQFSSDQKTRQEVVCCLECRASARDVVYQEDIAVRL